MSMYSLLATFWKSLGGMAAMPGVVSMPREDTGAQQGHISLSQGWLVR